MVQEAIQDDFFAIRNQDAKVFETWRILDVLYRTRKVYWEAILVKSGTKAKLTITLEKI